MKIIECRSCHHTLRHRARGRCDACYCWHQVHGWDRERPAPPTHCQDCGRSFRHRPHRALGRCDACYRRQWRIARRAAE